MDRLKTIMEDTSELEKFFSELGDILDLNSLEEYIKDI